MLHIKGLRKNYANFSLDCTLTVPPGTITGFVGQNGAGKSTTFKAILGLIRTDSGHITLLGKNSRDLTSKDRQYLGVALSDSGFSGHLTVRDIIPILDNLYPHFDRTFFIEQACRLKLPLRKKLLEFSTGMRAKLKMLIAISHDARLLLLDEPTAGLDVVARGELLDMLREYMEEKPERSALVSSHISSDLETLCDDIYMIDQGRILLHEDTDVLLSDYALLKVTPAQYALLDKDYLLKTTEENYGYCCLTDKRQFYQENYPNIAIEKGSIDGVITMMIQGG